MQEIVGRAFASCVYDVACVGTILAACSPDRREYCIVARVAIKSVV